MNYLCNNVLSLFLKYLSLELCMYLKPFSCNFPDLSPRVHCWYRYMYPLNNYKQGSLGATIFYPNDLQSFKYPYNNPFLYLKKYYFCICMELLQKFVAINFFAMPTLCPWYTAISIPRCLCLTQSHLNFVKIRYFRKNNKLIF